MHDSVLNGNVCRRTLVFSALSWTRTSDCRSTRRRLLSCTRERNAMKFHLMFTPLLTELTVACFSVSNTCDWYRPTVHANTETSDLVPVRPWNWQSLEAFIHRKIADLAITIPQSAMSKYEKTGVCFPGFCRCSYGSNVTRSLSLNRLTLGMFNHADGSNGTMLYGCCCCCICWDACWY